MNIVQAVNQYDEQAQEFKKLTRLSIKKTFVKHDYYFHSDRKTRDIYKITFVREGYKSFSFNFGQSIANQGMDPSDYDILACMDVVPFTDPTDLDDFLEFCLVYGYELGSKQRKEASKTFKAVVKQSNQLKKFFTESELEALQEIN